MKILDKSQEKTQIQWMSTWFTSTKIILRSYHLIALEKVFTAITLKPTKVMQSMRLLEIKHIFCTTMLMILRNSVA